MSLDERLELLLESCLSLHASVQELYRNAQQHSESLARADDRERKNRQVIVAAIQDYLDNLNGEESR